MSIQIHVHIIISILISILIFILVFLVVFVSLIVMITTMIRTEMSFISFYSFLFIDTSFSFCTLQDHLFTYKLWFQNHDEGGRNTYC